MRQLHFHVILVVLLLFACQAPWSRASSVIPLSTSEHITAADAILRGTVVAQDCFRDSAGLIFTRTVVRVDEGFKGTFPTLLALIHQGGQVGNEDAYCGFSPRFAMPGEYVLFVTRDGAGNLHCTQGGASAIPLLPTLGKSGKAEADYQSTGRELLEELRNWAAQNPDAGADVTDQAVAQIPGTAATTGMLGGVNTRFIQPDRGEPIPYYIDADPLPGGISITQATNAVAQALGAWTAVTSLKFRFMGLQSFGQAANTITTPNESIYIQLHDNYGAINTPNVLGVGGRGGSSFPSPSGWNIGGNVAGNEFLKTTYGYVVLESGNVSMQNLLTFTEVICHEIGHALNLAHSSENAAEPNNTLKEAMMYYQTHADNRGATLGTYDVPVIRQCYPSNTPPYTFNRVIDATSAPVPINVGGINEIELRGYDLQSPALTLATEGATANAGTFSLVGNQLKYTPAGYFSINGRSDPDTSGGSFSYVDLVYARFSDGTNASPYSLIRVLSMRPEATASPDGIPDYWMQTFFGHADPQAGDLSRATDDADGDGLNTLQEYLGATNPKNANSATRITSFDGQNLQFAARAYEPYEILGSTNLTTWTRITTILPTTPLIAVRTNLPQTNIIATVSNVTSGLPHQFYRVEKIP